MSKVGKVSPYSCTQIMSSSKCIDDPWKLKVSTIYNRIFCTVNFQQTFPSPRLYIYIYIMNISIYIIYWAKPISHVLYRCWNIKTIICGLWPERAAKNCSKFLFWKNLMLKRHLLILCVCYCYLYCFWKPAALNRHSVLLCIEKFKINL